jgi:hypothetical protein
MGGEFPFSSALRKAEGLIFYSERRGKSVTVTEPVGAKILVLVCVILCR